MLFLLVCACLPCLLFSQNAPHPTFRQYTTADGLASPETYCILQDREGFIWISSDNGVSRFDGYSFRNYGVKDGLLENVIFVMQSDSLGQVWMQAMSGNLYFFDGQIIRPYWHNNVLLKFKNRVDTSKGFIVEGAGETVHVALLNYGVITISKDGATSTLEHSEPFCWQVFEKNGVAILALNAHDEPGKMRTYQDELNRKKLSSPFYFHVDGAVWPFPGFVFSKKEGRQIDAFRLGDGKYLLKIRSDVWFIENGQVQWQRYFPHQILHARLMDHGKLFLGLHWLQGLRIFDSIDDFQKSEGTTWLSGQNVSYFMEDREGGKWFATIENGVFYEPADAFSVYDRESGLPNEKVTALTVKNDREIFAGLVNGEVWCLDRLPGKWTQLPGIPSSNFVKDLHFDPQNQQLWAGRDELFYLKENNWVRSAATYRNEDISIANRITESPGGKRLWVCNHIGFMSMDLPEMTPANIHKGYDQRTFIVREDFNGRVWAGQPKGLFELKDGALLPRQNLHPAFSLRVEDIALLPDSTLVIATKGGGIVFWKSDHFDQITTSQGLTADMLECVLADDKGVVWAGTLNGLNRITGTWGHRQVEQITVAHGLPSNEISRICTAGENVWVATNQGLVNFTRKNKSTGSPKPILASVLANNRSLDPTQPIQLPPKENNLTIGFFAINYKMNGNIPYRYRMDGSDWTMTMNRSLNFPALPPGECHFEVEAQNEDGVWSEPATLRFVINPPWWATWWAKLSGVIAIAITGSSIYLYRTGQLKKAYRIQLLMAELERSALQAQMNPHFIFNCLNSIQNFILQNEKQAAIQYLGSFASLVRSMLNASVAGKILLSEEVKLLNNYLKLEKLRFKNRFDFEVRTADGLDVFDIKIPPLLVQPYVENAVQHGISGRASGGRVEVFFEKKENYLEVSIRDNGEGLKNRNGQDEKPKTHKSFGMSITRRRLELLSKGKENNTVRVNALQDENGQDSGTQVVICIGLTEEFSSTNV